MLDKNDIKLLKGMFKENNVSLRQEFKQELKHELKTNNEVFGRDLKREIRDEMHSSISASENRVMKRMELLRLEMSLDMANFFDDRILPQIDRLDVRLNRVEKILKLA